jgi:hypothetical protein
LDSALRKVPLRVRAALEVLVVAALVSLGAFLVAQNLPGKYVATVIGFLFLGATGALVWRRDDATVEHYGLGLGGLVLPGAPWSKVIREGAVATAWGLGTALVVFVPYYFGFRFYWTRHGDMTAETRFAFDAVWGSGKRLEFLSQAAGQLLMIALPEEAFYRGYMQTRLRDAFPRTWRIGGAELGLAVLVTSVVFALGHIVTIPSPQRLAVFFPSLLFGYLRARTRGVGAGVLFHALCNIYSSALGHGFGIY